MWTPIIHPLVGTSVDAAVRVLEVHHSDDPSLSRGGTLPEGHLFDSQHGVRMTRHKPVQDSTLSRRRFRNLRATDTQRARARHTQQRMRGSSSSEPTLKRKGGMAGRSSDVDAVP
jgi:hypothetical protein